MFLPVSTSSFSTIQDAQSFEKTLGIEPILANAILITVLTNKQSFVSEWSLSTLSEHSYLPIYISSVAKIPDSSLGFSVFIPSLVIHYPRFI
jgi:hypothetical protein